MERHVFIVQKQTRIIPLLMFLLCIIASTWQMQRLFSISNQLISTSQSQQAITPSFPTLPAHANCEHSSGTNETVTISCKTIRYRLPLDQLASTKTLGLIFGVLSKSMEGRNNVRQTWKKDIPDDGVLYFIVAGEWTLELEQEYNSYNDMIWLDKDEAYRDLTYKTGAFISIVQYYHPTYSHLFKTDDDSYVNVEALERILMQQSVEYFGFCHRTPTSPVRPETPMNDDDMKKFVLTYDEYPQPTFPPYCSGAGYSMSANFVACVANLWSNTPYHPFEDVAMGLMAQQCGIKPTHTDAVYRQLRKHVDSDNNKIIDYNMTGVIVQHRAQKYMETMIFNQQINQQTLGLPG